MSAAFMHVLAFTLLTTGGETTPAKPTDPAAQNAQVLARAYAEEEAYVDWNYDKPQNTHYDEYDDADPHEDLYYQTTAD